MSLLKRERKQRVHGRLGGLTEQSSCKYARRICACAERLVLGASFTCAKIYLL